MEAFSDGVFAIAITLLILEIPRIHGSTHLARQLGDDWRQYVTYLVSFLTIGIIWVNHHSAMAHIARADRTLLFLNLALLLFVSVLPYPTGLLGEHLRGQDGEVAAAVYAATMLGMALSFLAINWHAGHNGLHHDHVSEEMHRRLIRRNAVGQVPYVIAVAIAFVSPAVSLAICGAIAIYYVFPWGVADPPATEG
jgi:uncharacterized membrane protein